MNCNFRKLVVAIIAFAVFYASAQEVNAAVVNLAWNPNPESNIAGYKVYYGTSSRKYTTVVNVGKFTSCLISGLANYRTYYFACTAYNTSGLESGYSNEVSYRTRWRRQ